MRAGRPGQKWRKRAGQWAEGTVCAKIAMVWETVCGRSRGFGGGWGDEVGQSG